jgi:hypothetical protein
MAATHESRIARLKHLEAQVPLHRHDRDYPDSGHLLAILGETCGSGC